MVIYDGFMRNTENIGSNIFITFTLLGCVELPCDLAATISLEKLGRRHTTVFTLLSCGFIAFIITAVPEGKKLYVLYFMDLNFT